MSTKLLTHEESLPLHAVERIDLVCDEFENELRDGHRPPIEAYLKDVAEPERSCLLRALMLLDLDSRKQAGDATDIGNYMGRFPQYGGLVREAFDILEPSTVSGSTVRRDSEALTRGGTCAAASESQDSAIDRYTINRSLGSGAFSDVFLAEDSVLQRRVALKLLKANCDIDDESFFGEARIAARLAHHNIAAVYDSGRQQSGNPFIVMQYIHGQTLGEKLASSAIDRQAAVDLVATVADALCYAHQHGLVHRDIKPSNLLIDKTGRPFITDFGFALHESVQHRHRGDRSGTPYYRAPEQVRGEADWIDGRTDIWALGVVLYEMITLRRPFQGASIDEIDEQILRRDPRPPRQIDGMIPQWLEQVCLRCLAKSPERRFATADALANALCAGNAGNEKAVVQVRHDAGKTIVSSSDAVVIIQGETRQGELQTAIPRLADNPYRGLSSFDENDAAWFFGREELSHQLWERLCDLQTRSAANRSSARLLPVVGPSGCGKSSLVHAGLIAELARRPLPGLNHMKVISLTPSTRPVESLASALARAVAGDVSAMEVMRSFQHELEKPNERGEFDGLRRIVNVHRDALQAPVLLLVDQFEELFSLCDSDEERRLFIDLLLLAAKDRSGHVLAVIALRSDFLGATQQHQELNGLISSNQLLVPAMSNDEQRRAIALPAKKCGYDFAPAFQDLLIDQVQGRSGALPLLQFTLHRLWQGIAEGEDPTDTLQQIGGVGGALANEAQRVYESLPETDRQIARRVFLDMVQLGEGTRDTRRRVSIGSLCGAAESESQIHDVIRQFATPATRLVTLSANANGEPTAEITHEALLDHWPTLRQWLNEDRDDLRLQRRVEDGARNWDGQRRPTGLLWRSPDLDLLRALHARFGDRLTQLQAEFLKAADKREAGEKRASLLRKRVYQFGSLVILGLFCVASYSAYRENLAKNEETIAKTQAIEANELAQDQTRLALETLESMVYSFHDRLQDLPGDDGQALREQLIHSALSGIEDVASEGTQKAALNVEARRRLARIYLTLGGDGNIVKAQQQYEECQRILSQLDINDPKAPQEWVMLDNRARVQDGFGDVCRAKKQSDQAERHYKLALEHRERWLAVGPMKATAEQAIANSFTKLGQLSQLDRSLAKTTLDYFLKSLEIRRKFYDSEPDRAFAESEFGNAWRDVGKARHQLGEYELATQHYERAIKLARSALKKWQAQPGLQSEFRQDLNLCIMLENLARTYIYVEKDAAAIEPLREAIQRTEHLYEANSNRTDIRRTLWRSYYALATVRMDDDPKEADRLFRLAADLNVGVERRMLALARCHRRDDAAELAVQLRHAARETHGAERRNNYYYASCGYALCAWSTKQTGTAQEFEEYSNAAMECLEAAALAGFPIAEDVDNPELDAIRDHPRFQQLLNTDAEVTDSPLLVPK